VSEQRLVLTLETIPQLNFGISLAQLLPKPVWDTVRREVYAKAHYTCEICGAMDVQLHCHEVWSYTSKKPYIQKLQELKCLCKDCHAIKHWWHTVGDVHSGKEPTVYLKELTVHFCTVNHCDVDQFELHKVITGALADSRNKHDYKIDWGAFEPRRIEQVWLKHQGKSTRT